MVYILCDLISEPDTMKDSTIINPNMRSI